MKIYTQGPANWRDLQNKVACLLSEIGFHCEVEKNIRSTREIINVDVYAINEQDIPKNQILCECKYWGDPVPKTIIHAFRTTVTDFGANHGIIISKAGFQSGAYDAIKNTNISLMNWDDFEEYFKARWIKNMQYLVSLKTKPLYDYISSGFLVFFKKEYNNLSVTKKNKFNSLNLEYFDYAFNSSNLEFKGSGKNEVDVNMFDSLLKNTEKISGNNFSSLEDYYNFLINKSEEGVKKFDSLFGRKLRRKK